MFLQNILQQRLKSLNEEEERYLSVNTGPGAVKADGSVLGGAGQNILTGGGGFNNMKVIGSIQNQQVNYSNEHTFFGQQHMNAKAKMTVPIVKDEIDRDRLGLKKPKWNESVAIPDRIGNSADGTIKHDIRDMDQSQKTFLIRQGFLDERITRSDPQTTYAGCDTRDVYYHGWDVSHETTPPRDKERQYQIERAFLLDKTARMADRMINQCNKLGKEKTSYGITHQQYIRPEQISHSINQKLRAEKEDETALWDELLKKARHEMPGASDEKLRAIVYRQIQQIKHGKKEEPDPELTFKPDVTLSQFSKAPAPEKPKKKGWRTREAAALKAKQQQEAIKNAAESESDDQ